MILLPGAGSCPCFEDITEGGDPTDGGWRWCCTWCGGGSLHRGSVTALLPDVVIFEQPLIPKRASLPISLLLTNE